MPFKSESQRRFMYSQHPEMAKKWEKHTPKNKKLPEHVKKSKKKKSKKRTHKECFLNHLSGMLLTEDTQLQLWKIEIYGFTNKPQYTHANSALEATTNIIAREFKQNNRIFKNKVYPTLDHLIVAIIGPKGSHRWVNVQFERIDKTPAKMVDPTPNANPARCKHCGNDGGHSQKQMRRCTKCFKSLD